MPQRQNPEVRQQEVMPMFQNRDVTTAAVILNNVIGSSFPRQAMNLVTPMDEPIPMGHDCTRCAAVSTCSLLNIVNENGGDNPIARRMKAIDMIKADNPDFIQKTSAEEREVLIKEKMMALKEQDLKQNIAQESETPVAQMEQLHTPQLSIVTEIKKTEKETTDPQTIDITNARNQDNYEPTHIPSPMEVEVNPVTPNSVHGASLPRLNRGLHSGHFHDHFVINTNSSPLLPTGHSGNGVKPKSIPAPIPSKQELKPKPNVKKPTLPITIQIESARKPFQRPNTNTRQIKPLEKRTGIVIPQTDKKIAAADIIHGEKRKSLQDLSPVIIIQNIPFPRHLLIKQKSNPGLNRFNGEIFKYSRSSTNNQMSSERKTAKKPIQVFRSFPTDAVSETKSIESDNPIQIRLARNITISSLYSFSLISLQSLDVNLPRQSTREIAKSLKTAHTQERGEPRRKSTEELPKDRLGTIQQLLEDFTQKQRPKKIGSVLSRLSQDPETQSDLVKNKLTESLEEKIQRLFTKENIVPFAVAILRMSREESIDLGRLFDYDKQAVNYKESTEEYEILPISQLGFLYLISLSTQINRFIDLLTVVQAYQIEKQVSLIEYIDSLFAQEEMKTVLKNQTTNISIIIWYMVQVIRSIGLFNIIFTFTP